MNIYLDSGYLNMRHIYNELCIKLGLPFIFIIGQRATGKTYGSLEFTIEDEIKFMLMRRTQSQADLINKPEFSPFKSLNRDHGWNIYSRPLSKYNAGFYQDEEGGLPIGYTCALSTVANMRGFDAQDVELTIYDEFIAERHERPIKNEASAFFNAYETMNRNRELKGLPPMHCLMLANSNDIANPYFMELGLIRTLRKMLKRKQTLHIDKVRGLAIIFLHKSRVSEQKRETALYRLTKGTQFSSMALDNKFNNEVAGKIRSMNLKEYRPLVAIGELCLYEHKSNDTIYASTHKSGKFETYKLGDVERMRFKREWRYLWDEYMDNNITFEEYTCEVLFNDVFK